MTARGRSGGWIVTLSPFIISYGKQIESESGVFHGWHLLTLKEHNQTLQYLVFKSPLSSTSPSVNISVCLFVHLSISPILIWIIILITQRFGVTCLRWAYVSQLFHHCSIYCLPGVWSGRKHYKSFTRHVKTRSWNKPPVLQLAFVQSTSDII